MNTSSSSSGTVQQVRSSGSDEEVAQLPQTKEAMNAAFPTLNGKGTSASLEIDVAAPQTVSVETKAVVTTPRKFSDVVSHTTAAPALAPEMPSVQEESSKPSAEPVVMETSKTMTASFDPKVKGAEKSAPDAEEPVQAAVKLVQAAKESVSAVEKPVQSAKEPVQAVKKTIPAAKEPVNTAKPAETIKPVATLQAVKPAEPVKSTVVKPEEPVATAAPAESAKPTTSVATVKPAVPVDPVSPVKSVKKPVEVANSAKTAKIAEQVNPSPKKEPVVPANKDTIKKSPKASDDSSEPSTSVKSTSRPVTAESKSNGSPVVSTTSALRVDTSDEKILASLASSPTPTRTVAEVVQQNLSATPSPAPKTVTSAQPSPVVKSTEKSITVHDASKDSSTREKPKGDQNKKGKRDQQPPKPSMSYAQMLYPKEKEKKKEDHTPSTSSSTSGKSASSQSKNSPTVAPTDWHTVKNKKAAEPVAVESPVADQSFPALPPNQNGKSTSKPSEPAASDNDDVPSEDPELEKKRQKRRNKRQKAKEANKQQKQEQKQQARQESLARVEQMNGANGSVQAEEPVKPAFDRNDLAARRRRRLELQRRSENPETPSPPQAPSMQPSAPAPTRTVQSNTAPVFSLIPGGLGANALNASIAAGHAAMGAYGLANLPNRSPFSITKNGTNKLPLYLPPQAGLRTNQDGSPGAVVMEQDPNSTTSFVPIVVRQVPPEDPKHDNVDDSPPMQVAEDPEMKTFNADPSTSMIKQILKFDEDNVLANLELSTTEGAKISSGLEQIREMWSRVHRAGNLMSYRALSSTVPELLEGKILDLTIKLLSSEKQLTEKDIELTQKVGSRLENPPFSFSSASTGLLSLSNEKSETLPPGEIREKYKAAATLTQEFLDKSEDLHSTISKYYKFPDVEQ